MRAGGVYLGIKGSEFEGLILLHLLCLHQDDFTNGTFVGSISDN